MNNIWIFQEVNKSNLDYFLSLNKKNCFEENFKTIFFIDEKIKGLVFKKIDNIECIWFAQEKSLLKNIYHFLEQTSFEIKEKDFFLLSYSEMEPDFSEIKKINFDLILENKIDFINLNLIQNLGPFGSSKSNDFFFRFEKGSYITNIDILKKIKPFFDNVQFVNEDVLFGYFAESKSFSPIRINTHAFIRGVNRSMFSNGDVIFLDEKNIIAGIKNINKIDSYTRIPDKEFLELFRNLALYRKNKKSKLVLKYIGKSQFRKAKKISSFFNNKYDERQINFDYDKFSNGNNLETINLKQYKVILEEIFIKFMKVMNKYNVPVTSIGLTVLGQIISGRPLDYDDDIDVLVSLKSFYAQKKLIIRDLKREGIHITLWHEKNSHIHTPTVNKAFTYKIYRVIDKKMGIDTIATPFVDFAYSNDWKNKRMNEFNNFISKRILKFKTDSKLSSYSVLFYSKSFKKWIPIRNVPRVKFKLWTISLYFWLGVYNFGLYFSKFSSEKKIAERKITTYDFDQKKWGAFYVSNDETKDFFNVQNLMYPLNYKNAFIKRYGSEPEVLKNEKANLVHLNKEGISFLTNRYNWLNSKKVANITRVSKWYGK